MSNTKADVAADGFMIGGGFILAGCLFILYLVYLYCRHLDELQEQERQDYERDDMDVAP